MLHRVQWGIYEVVLRLTDPQNQAEVAPVRGLAGINAEALLLEAAAEAYGRLLTAQVFADAAVRGHYVKARAAFESAGLLLRVRVTVEPTALELHDLRWELLRDPETDAPMATSERILLSRFMRSSQDWRPVRLRPRAQLRAVIAVSAPTNAADYGLARVDLAGEVARARAALADIEVQVVGEAQPLVLDRLVDALRGGADIVYLVCHGTLTQQLEPVLFLQNAAGAAAPVKGAELALRIGELPQVPRLMVLASCESAGKQDAARPTSEASLAPLLANAGVPAVLAMQGRISMQTVRIFMPRFFRELLADGQIDRAIAVARGVVRTHRDHWMPALFLRLKGGRLWYEPRLTGTENPLSQWKALCQCIFQGRFLPILGPDLDEGLFGGLREVALRLAAKHTFPNADHERHDLAKVAQFVSVQKDRRSAHKAVQTELVELLRERRPAVAAASDTVGLPALLDMIVARDDARLDAVYGSLARLQAPIYIMASPETLLFKTVKARGASPEALYCRWRATRSNTPQEPRPRAEPTPETPLIYHVFGVFGAPESLVLTEDDFFDFLIATSTYKLIPRAVRGSLTDSALLFLGFRLDDWTFRVLFRLIMNLEGSAGMRKYAHVGVQVNPEEHSLADAQRARRYLERYFGSDRGAGLSEPPISIYWGSPADFLAELDRRMKEIDQEKAPPVAPEGDGGWF